MSDSPTAVQSEGNPPAQQQAAPAPSPSTQAPSQPAQTAGSPTPGVDIAQLTRKAQQFDGMTKAGLDKLAAQMARHNLTAEQLIAAMTEDNAPEQAPQTSTQSQPPVLDAESIGRLIEEKLAGVLTARDQHQQAYASWQQERNSITESLKAKGLQHEGDDGQRIQQFVDAGLSKALKAAGMDPQKSYATPEMVQAVVEDVSTWLSGMKFKAQRDAAVQQSQTAPQTLGPGSPPGSSEDAPNTEDPMEHYRNMADSVIQEVLRAGATASG